MWKRRAMRVSKAGKVRRRVRHKDTKTWRNVCYKGAKAGEARNLANSCLLCLHFFMCLTCLQFFKCFQITFTLCAITFFIKCGTTHNQLQHAGISKNDDKPKMLKQAKTTPGNTGVLLLTKYPCEYFLVTPNWILLNRAPTST